jgi:hypothetical protein
LRDTSVSRASTADIWPYVLSDRHIGKSDLNGIAWKLHKQKRLVIRGLSGRQRTPKDENLIELAE